MDNTTKITNPAHIQISFARISSSDNHQFYGSDIEANSYIKLTISESSQERRLGGDNYYGGKTILHAVMTNLQFSELITTLNIGSGTPATLTYLNTDHLPQGRIELPSIVNKAKIINEEIKQEMDKAEENLDELQAEIEGLRISQVKKQNLISKLNHSRASILKRVQFNIDRAREEIGRMTVDAKATLESFYTGLCMKLGVKSLEDQRVKLIEDESEN